MVKGPRDGEWAEPSWEGAVTEGPWGSSSGLGRKPTPDTGKNKRFLMETSCEVDTWSSREFVRSEAEPF